MFSRAYGYILRHPATKRGYWGNWYYKRRYERVLERVAASCNSTRNTLFDFGCGVGFYARYLEEKGIKCDYVGCDIEDYSIKLAYRGENTNYVKCDIRQLPFRYRSAFVVLCSEVLEHLQLPYRALEEISRVARRSLVITFPQERLLTVLRTKHPEHVSSIEAEKVTALLASRGFRPVNVSYIFTSFFPCGVLEFLHVPRNDFTQAVVSSVDKLLSKITPSRFVPHRTVLIEATLVSPVD